MDIRYLENDIRFRGNSWPQEPGYLPVIGMQTALRGRVRPEYLLRPNPDAVWADFVRRAR